MSIQIDPKTKEILLSVTELAADSPFQSSGGHSASLARMTAGRKIHENYQRQQLRQIEDYEKEYFIEHRTEIEDYSVIVQGRIDGLYQDQTTTIVEEIKSVILSPTQFEELTEHSFEHYRNQLRLYCYFLQQHGYANVRGLLIYINLIDNSRQTILINYDQAETSDFLHQRLRFLFQRIHENQIRANARAECAKKLEFPYPSMRNYQDEMVHDIGEALANREDILISAPTGIGKTVAALFPSLKHALENNLSIFYITSKTTQQQIARTTLELMIHPDLDIRGIVLQAREKICLNDQLICHDEFCPYARDYMEKLSDGSILEELLLKRVLTPQMVRKVAKQKLVCPFELSLDLSLLVDVIICDYNYVFDPGVYLRRFFFETKYDDILLIIDEAHNLYQRGREYYSPEISQDQVQHLLYQCERQLAPIFGDFKKILLKIDGIFKGFINDGHKTDSRQTKFLVEFDPKQFSKIKDELEELMLNYLIYKKLNAVINPTDPFDDFYYSFRIFQNVLSIKGDEFAHICDESNDTARLKILCKDPSNQLKKRLDGFTCAIAMSATLEPLTFYRDVLGFRDIANCRSYPSPFPAENQKIIIEPRISTRFNHRAGSYEPIANTISKIISLKPGNYFAFFPSFDYLEKVYEHLYVTDIAVIAQSRYMKDRERSEVLEQLRDPQQNTLVLAVQGGIFAEGVDYSGEMLAGAFVIGPALPAYTFEQELMKQYYQETYGKGFEYAYLYPGMSRVIQSVGRVIRSEYDVGMILLIGQRFATSYYNSLFPQYWYQTSPFELISQNPVEDVMAFWETRIRGENSFA